MIKYQQQTFINYKVIKLDKNIHLIIYETNEIEVIGKHISLPIRINNYGNKYIIEGKKVIFIEKYLDKNINYKFKTLD